MTIIQYLALPLAFLLLTGGVSAESIPKHEGITTIAVTDFQNRLMSEYDPMQECVHAGFNRQWVILSSQLQDTSVEEALSPNETAESHPPMRQEELDIWAQTHSSSAVANYRFEWCMQHFALPEINIPSPLMQHCFAETELVLDIAIAKHWGIPAAWLKSFAATAPAWGTLRPDLPVVGWTRSFAITKSNIFLSLPQEKLDTLIDNVYTAYLHSDEDLVAREFFSSCIGANAHQ